jgi:hypothetical protein
MSKQTTWAALRQAAIEHPSARANMNEDGGQHFMEVINPYGEDATVGLTVNR